MISKADIICYLATGIDPEHADVDMLTWTRKDLYAGPCWLPSEAGKLERWSHHPAIQEPVEWTPMTANGIQIYTAHPTIKQFLLSLKYLFCLFLFVFPPSSLPSCRQAIPRAAELLGGFLAWREPEPMPVTDADA